jgi:copper chaperone
MFTLSYSFTYLATARLALMSTQRFKTTINCANCVRAITPVLNAEPAITAWQVDTANPDKLLTVTSELPAAQVVALVEEAGFEAQAVA